MTDRVQWIVLGGAVLAGLGAAAWLQAPRAQAPAAETAHALDGWEFPVKKTDAEWKSELTSEQFDVCRLGGTERAFTGAYWDEKTPGIYRCIACGHELFSSETKFESGTGWPSFWAPLDPERVIAREDRSFGMVRTEVLCRNCGAHLGHVFDDGPQPTGQRYCINSVALKLEPAQEEPSTGE